MNGPVTVAKPKLAGILHRAAAGEEIAVTRHGKPRTGVKAPEAGRAGREPIGMDAAGIRAADGPDTVIPPGWEECGGR